jgi:hypothetical protein
MPSEPTDLPARVDPREPAVVRLRLEGDPNTDAKAARAFHGRSIAGMVYTNALAQRIGRLLPKPMPQSAMLYVDDLIERMAPRDPAEEMLVIQLVLTHARVLHLTHLANMQERPESIRTVHEYADRASNTCRRLMLALAEYRRPARTGDSFTAIKQANIAGQQVIQNHENLPAGNATNEQGCGHTNGPAALPAVGGRVEVATAICPAGEALDPIHRPPDAQGQGPVKPERMEAR